MGVLDWLNDTGLFGGSSDPMSQAGAAASANMGATPPPMPPVQMTGSDVAALNPPQYNPGAMAPPVNPATTDIGAGLPPGGTGAPPTPPTPSPPIAPVDPSMTDIAGGIPAGGTGSAPLPQPRPPGAPGAPGAGPPPTTINDTPLVRQVPGDPPPGAPLNITSPAQNAPQPAPAPAFNPTMFGRMLGVTSADQATKYGQQSAAGLAAGLKSVGQNWNKPGLAAFAGSAGSAMEGGQKQADVQAKQATDYLKAAVEAKKAGNDQVYKAAMGQYYVAKALEAQKNAMASKDAATNKNDTPTQLYLAAQRLVQNDPEVVDARKALESARKIGEAADVQAATNRLQQIVQQKQTEHLAGVGLHPQTAAQIAKMPGNSRENPLNPSTKGITPENFAGKMQIGQWYTDPKAITEKNPQGLLVVTEKSMERAKAAAAAKGSSVSGVPSKPTTPAQDQLEPTKKKPEDDDDED